MFLCFLWPQQQQQQPGVLQQVPLHLEPHVPRFAKARRATCGACGRENYYRNCLFRFAFPTEADSRDFTDLVDLYCLKFLQCWFLDAQQIEIEDRTSWDNSLKSTLLQVRRWWQLNPVNGLLGKMGKPQRSCIVLEREILRLEKKIHVLL